MARILVIERETGLGGVVQRLHRTHRVSTVTDTESALALLAAGERFDAVVCDIQDWRVLHDSIAQVDADQAQRMLVLDPVGSPNAVIDQSFVWLTKPFTLDQLHVAITAILSKDPGKRTEQ